MVDALTWIASHCMFVTEGKKALRILACEFSRSDQLAAYIGVSSRYGEPSAPYEELLRAVLKNNPHPEMQVSARAALAVYLKMAKERSERNLVRISLQGRQFMLPETSWNLDRLMERGLDNVAAESETLFEQLVKQYGDVRLEGYFPHEAGAFAKQQLFELKNLSIGRKALEIEGKDISGKAMKLSDYHGKVVVLDFGSHRMCGVCRAMYPELRRIVKQFEGKPFALIGINAGDDINELKDLTKNRDITWRLLWDGDEVEGPITSR